VWSVGSLLPRFGSERSPGIGLGFEAVKVHGLGGFAERNTCSGRQKAIARGDRLTGPRPACVPLAPQAATPLLELAPQPAAMRAFLRPHRFPPPPAAWRMAAERPNSVVRHRRIIPVLAAKRCSGECASSRAANGARARSDIRPGLKTASVPSVCVLVNAATRLFAKSKFERIKTVK